MLALSFLPSLGTVLEFRPCQIKIEKKILCSITQLMGLAQLWHSLPTGVSDLWPVGGMWLGMSVHSAQLKIVNLLKTL